MLQVPRSEEQRPETCVLVWLGLQPMAGCWGHHSGCPCSHVGMQGVCRLPSEPTLRMALSRSVWLSCALPSVSRFVLCVLAGAALPWVCVLVTTACVCRVTLGESLSGFPRFSVTGRAALEFLQVLVAAALTPGLIVPSLGAVCHGPSKCCFPAGAGPHAWAGPRFYHVPSWFLPVLPAP